MRVLEAADRRLTEVRRGMPDAAGLVIAYDHADARAYAALLRDLTGARPVVVLSDDPVGKQEDRQRSPRPSDRWMVAVRMVSEGVDIPRLAVGVYATSVGTALFFAQAVGRFVRARHRGETASVFLPSIPSLLGYAAELEAERDHVLAAPDDATDDERELAEAQRQRDTADELGEAPFKALGASAHFDRVLYDGGEFGVDRRGGGLPRPARAARAGPGRGAAPQAAAGQVTQNPQPEPRPHRRPAAQPSQPTARETLAALRKELNSLIAAWHHRTGQPHGAIHADLRRSCGGPPLPQATADRSGPGSRRCAS